MFRLSDVPPEVVSCEILAASKNHTVLAFLKEEPVLSRFPDLSKALTAACNGGQLELVKWLKEKGAPLPNEMDLYEAIYSGNTTIEDIIARRLYRLYPQV